jgi:RNA polymerase sigma factor (sigma-70 family)
MLRISTSVKEEQLLRGCQNGEPKAQKALYDRYASRMLAVCVRYVGDRNEAEHVMIGGMVKVFEKVAQFQEAGSFEGWIRRIMVNESLMYIRKNKALSLAVDIEGVNEEPNYESTAGLHADELMQLIEELPVGYRTVFNLYAIEGYKHEEIGEMLGISEGTSKSQLNRARKLLQQRLAEMESETQNYLSYES